MKNLILFSLILLTPLAAHAASINLTWQDNSDNEDAFTVERSTDGEVFAEVATVPADTTAYTDDGLQTGATYYYRVRALNEYGYSGYTNVAAGTAKGVPADPSGLEAAAPSPTLRITVRDDGSIVTENIQ